MTTRRCDYTAGRRCAADATGVLLSPGRREVAYYCPTQGPNAVFEATREWAARMAKLQEVLNDLIALAEAIDVQGERP